jgi:hypothetical protein
MERARSETDIDETLAASFPASDPPSWTLGMETQAVRIGSAAMALAEAEATWGSNPETRRWHDDRRQRPGMSNVLAVSRLRGRTREKGVPIDVPSPTWGRSGS